jgi:hypothetical protein
LGLLILLLMSFLVPSTISAQDVTVSIDAPAEVDAGTSFIVRVNITDVVDFDACDYNITYDPAVFNMTDATAGLIGGSTIPVELWNEFVSGTVSVVENVPGISGVSGSGYLAELHFDSISEYSSTSEIVITDGTLGDNTATQIQAIWTGASVDVIGLPVPTPTLSPTPTASLTPTETPVPSDGSDIEIWVWIVAGFIFILLLVVIIGLVIRLRR